MYMEKKSPPPPPPYIMGRKGVCVGGGGGGCSNSWDGTNAGLHFTIHIFPLQTVDYNYFKIIVNIVFRAAFKGLLASKAVHSYSYVREDNYNYSYVREIITITCYLQLCTRDNYNDVLWTLVNSATIVLLRAAYCLFA